MKAFAAWPVLVAASVSLAQVEPGKPAGVGPINPQPAAEAKVAQPLVLDTAGILATRPVWPINAPLYVRINRLPFYDAKPHDVTLRSDLASAPAIEQHVYESGISCVMAGPDMTWDDQEHLAGTPTKSLDGVTFSVNVADPQGKDPKAPQRPQGPIKLPVQVKGTVDDILTATPLPDLDAALPKELNAHFYRRGWNSRGSARLWLGTYTNCEGAANTQYPGICHVLAKHPDVTFAVRVDVVHDGKVMATASAWWRGTAQYKSVDPFEGMLALEILDKTFDDIEPRDGKWRLHFTPAPEVALRDFESTRYWKGDVTTPVKMTDSSDWTELKANGEDK